MSTSERDSEISRRVSAAVGAIQQSFSNGDSPAAQFVLHHLAELGPAYWLRHTGTATPQGKQVIDLLELRSHWGGEGDDDEGLDVFDFTLPDGVTDYVIAVRFDTDGKVQGIEMES